MSDNDAFRVVGIISSFNEEDIIDPVLAHLDENGIEPYLVDNRSTDGTVDRAREWLGKGLLGIETFPPEPTADDAPVPWTRILERKTELATKLGADWYIHHDADEIREAPWPGMSLRDAVRWVDRLGFNAIDFRLLNFPPVDDRFIAGSDPKTHFTRFEDGPEHDRIQRKCWKAGASELSLADGGHDVRFEGRRLFPIPFLLRHYPIRGQGHGTRKVLAERKGRFAADEMALGWHRQYNHVNEGFNFLRNPASLRSFDLEQVRLETLVQSGGERTTKDGVDDPPASEYEGVLDRVDEKHIIGWARAIGGEDRVLAVDLWDGDRKFATVAADVMRADLEAAGKGNGRSGFVLSTPPELHDDRRHWIWATVAGTPFALRGSPNVFGSAAGSPDSGEGAAPRAAGGTRVPAQSVE